MLGALLTICVSFDSLFAQRGSPQGAPPQPTYRAAVVSLSTLTADADSDELIADLKLETLADGMLVVSGGLAKATRPPVPNRSLFVLVDAQARTYRSFWISGRVEDNARLKAHLKSRHNIDWDENRKIGRQARIDDIPEPQPRQPQLAARARRAAQLSPRLVFASFLRAQQERISSCGTLADIAIETRDVFGYGTLLARSRTFAGWIQDVYINPSFVQNWADAFNSTYPVSPTAAQTHWYLDAGTSTQDAYSYPDELHAFAEQSTNYYNDDFPYVFGVPDLGRTWAWHRIVSKAQAPTTWIHFGNKNEYGGYSYLIGSNILDSSWTGCF